MRSRLLLVLALAALAVGSSSCAAQPPKTPNTSSVPATSATPPAASLEPSPTVKVDWFWSNRSKDMPLFRLVAHIANPGSKTLEGVQVEWVAYDAGNSIVGSYKGTEPSVPASATVPYVGGAGGANLSGVPTRVDIHVVDPGHFVDGAPTAYIVSNIQIKRESKNEYNVKAKVKTGSEEVSSKDLFADLVLRDKTGKVVGGDFWFPERLPDRLSPGTAFTIEFAFVQVTGVPTSADVLVTERTQQP